MNEVATLSKDGLMKLPAPEESSVTPAKADKVTTIRRIVTSNLLTIHGGTQEDIPDRLAGQLSPYSELKKQNLQAIYRQRYGKAAPTKWGEHILNS